VTAAPAIEVDGLAKRYDGGVEALRGVSFEVQPGEVFGLLGRNGAGKSTTVRILTTLIRATAGEARVGGFDVRRQPGEVRRSLGAALQEAALDELMTGREHLTLAARLAGFAKAAAAARATELLESFGLIAAADRVAATYSGGMRRRLDVAMAMVRRPTVLFLDEPTTGLDPQGRRALWGLIRELRDQGSAVFLTTQYLAEADELSDRVAIVHDGEIAAIGAQDELKGRLGTTTLRLRVGPGGVPRLRHAFGPDELTVQDDGWVVLSVAGGEASVPATIAELLAGGIQIERLEVHPPSLEDVFVNLTGAEIEATPGGGDGGGAMALSAIRRGMGRPAAR
jgi:ABC-2 type transport system ATP-binding protein